MRSIAAPTLGAILLLTLVSSPANAARQRSTSGPIDRTLIQEDDYCPSEISVTPGEFLADGLETTVEFRARNLGYEFLAQGRAAGQPTLWMFSAIDAVSILSKSIHDQNTIEMPCVQCDSTGGGQALAWDLVDPLDFAYFENFSNGIPQEWSLDDGAWENNWNTPTERTSTNTPSDSVDCEGDRTGNSLGLGHFTDPNEFVSTYATIPDLTPGEEYVLSYWWHAHADSDATNGDLEVTIWGEEPWEDVTPAAAGGLTTTWAVAWGDVDGDGFDDLYLARGTGSTPKNLLLKNDGVGGFVDATPAILDDLGDAGCASWADVDNDSDPDLLLLNWDLSGNHLFRNDGGFAFSDMTPAEMNPWATGWASAWADYDLDGDLDVYVSRLGDNNSLYRNDGNFQLTQVAGSLLQDGPQSHGVAWGDYDDDGDPDLYLVRNNFQNYLFRNDDGSFAEVAAGPLADTGPGRDAAWGDFDNDGDLDLAVANFGASDLLLENQGGVFVDVTPPALAVANLSNAVTWQDVDLDGDLDLFIATEATNSLLLNDGGGVWAESIGGPFPRTDPFVSVGGAFSDMDDDGDPDLYVANRMGAADQLFRNDDGAGEHWLAIDLQGTLSNATGVGARIELTAGGVTQRRDVGFDVPFSSQGTLRALFGVGAATTVDAITVYWPSGLVQDYPSFRAIDQRVLLVENDPTGVVMPQERPTAFALGRPSPNPFGSVSTIPFELPRRANARVEVFDVTGRRVTTLVDQALEPGLNTARWDARDSQGRRVASGIYFVRLRAEGFTASRKITLR